MCFLGYCFTQRKIFKVYEDDLVIAFLDNDPIQEGHILIVPKQHYLDIDEIPDDLLNHLFSVTKKVVKAMKKTYSLDGYSLMQNGGIFNDIGHFHLHLFPRYQDDGFGWNCNDEKVNVNQEIADNLKKLL